MTVESAPPVMKTVDLADVRPQDRGEVWRVVAAPDFDVSDLPERMSARGVAYYLGPLILTRSRHPRQTLIRTAERLRRDGVDDIFCSLELDDGVKATVDDTILDVEPGRIWLWDLNRPSAKISQPGETLCLRIERDAWRRAVGGDPPIHGLTLGSLGALFRDHLVSLERMVASDPDYAMPTLGCATLQMLAACVVTERARELLQPVQPIVLSLLAERVERYVRAHLADPTLSPERIAQAIGASRSGLYTAMEPVGGVATYIRRRRVEAAHAMLTTSKDARIGGIALAVGFNGQTQFNRAFKDHFGYPPGEARGLQT